MRAFVCVLIPMKRREKIDKTNDRQRQKMIPYICCYYYGYMARHQIEMNMIRLFLLCKCGCKFLVLLVSFQPTHPHTYECFAVEIQISSFANRRSNQIQMDVFVHRLSGIVNNHLTIQAVEFSDSIEWLNISFYFTEENLKLKKWQRLFSLVSFSRSTHSSAHHHSQGYREKCATKKATYMCYVLANSKI